MVPFATASDGGGSIRTPASFTGLVGLKCTYGRIPTFGDTHLAQNSVVGSLTTNVLDTALLLDVMAGPDARDRTSLPAPTVSYVESIDRIDLSRCRVAWSTDLGFAVVDSRVAALCHDAAQEFVTSIGAAFVDRPIVLEDYIGTYVAVEGVDKFVGVDRELWENHLDELDPHSATSWSSLSERTLPWAAHVESNRRRLVNEVATILEDVDLIVTPMSCMPPFAAEGPMPTVIEGVEVHGGMSVVLAMLANLVNLPAISLPAGLVDGLPVGLQVIAHRFREDLLLAAAARYEAHRPWPRHRSVLHMNPADD
jgi:Asp-tRNA(Asn)/Glu-tRNA(Gln) amidotransferase A subunit family amidase